MWDQHVIETPENISFGYPIAGIGSRFLATLVDVLIQGTLDLLLAVLLVVLWAVAGPSAGQLPEAVSRWLPTITSVLAIVALFLIQFGYYVVFEILTGGRSPGKDLVGLRVVKENGYPLTPLDIVIRNLVRIVDFLPAAYGVGVITMFLNARSRRLGDLAAGTFVVRVERQVRLGDLRDLNVPTEAAFDWPGVVRLRPAEVELIESFLQRQRGFKNADALAAAIARRVCTTMATPEAEDFLQIHPPARFLEHVLAGYVKLTRGDKPILPDPGESRNPSDN